MLVGLILEDSLELSTKGTQEREEVENHIQGGRMR